MLAGMSHERPQVQARFQAILGVCVPGVPGESPIQSPSYPAHQLQKREHPKGGAHEAQVGSQRRHRRSHALCGAAGPGAHFRRELSHGDRELTTLRPRSRRCSGAATEAPAAGPATDPRTEPTGERSPAPLRPRPRPARRPRPLTQGSPALLWVEIMKKSSDWSTRYRCGLALSHVPSVLDFGQIPVNSVLGRST